MNILLDTHIIIFLFNDDVRLSSKAKKIILDKNNTFFYSIASVWEVALKNEAHPNKFSIDENMFIKYCDELGLLPLHVTIEHIKNLRNLKKPDNLDHKDLFDRILLSQSKTEGFMFMTHDDKICKYLENNIIFI